MSLKQYTIPRKITRTLVEEMLFANSASAVISLIFAAVFAMQNHLPITIVFLVLGAGCTRNYHELVAYSRKRGWVRK